MVNELEALAARERITAAYAVHQWAPHPNFDPADMQATKRLAWAELEHAGAPLAAPGQRLYVLGFVGPGPSTKVGMATRTPRNKENYLKQYLRSHERTALTYGCFMVRAWISRPLTSGVRDWEQKALDAVEALDGAERHREFFYGVDFDTAVEAVKVARKTSLAG